MAIFSFMRTTSARAVDIGVSIAVVDGKPKVSYLPVLSEVETAKRVYTTYGKARLQDAEWSVVPLNNEVNYNFFRVAV